MTKFVQVAAVLMLVCAAAASLAYDLVNDVIDDGGTKMMSSGYVARGSIGQPTIGKATSVGYVAYIGFWHPYPMGPGVEEDLFDKVLPLVYSLSQNYPNPVTTLTTIRYSLAQKAGVELAVYNTAGQRMGDLVSETQDAGHYSVRWNLSEVSGAELPNGVYFYRIAAGDFIETKKMVIMR